jgi:predicted transcriptional regulator
VRRVVQDYFEGSPKGLLSHFIEKEELSMDDLDALLKVIRERKQHQ